MRHVSDYYDEDKEILNKYLRHRAKGGKKYPCPTCGEPNALTKYEKRHGFQCDACADKAEAGIDGF